MKLVGLATLSATATQIEITGIPQDANHLMVRASVRGSSTNNLVFVRLGFNGNTSSYIDRASYRNTTSAAVTYTTNSATSARVGTVSVGSLTSTFAGIEIEIPYYRRGTTKWGTAYHSGVDNTTLQSRSIAGGFGWANSAAISSIQLLAQAGSFQIGTRLAVYTF